MSISVAVRPTLCAVSCILLLSGVVGCGGGGGGAGTGGSGGAGGNNSGDSGGGGGSNLTLGLSTNTVEFAAFSPGFSQPPSQRVYATVTGTDSGTLYVVITPSNPAVATVDDVVVSTTDGSAEIIPGSPIDLGVGTHTATITVRACLNSPTCTTNQLNGSPQTVTVTYNVNGLSSSQPSLTFPIGNMAQADDLAKSFTISAYPIVGWTATTDIPFLSISPTQGGLSLDTAVTASIDAAQLDEYEGGEYSGTIRFESDETWQAELEVPVTLNITRTRVNFVAPYAVQAGVPGEVIIRGESFSAAPPTGVVFGSTNAANFTVISDTEIRATYPPLAAGDHVVQVTNAQGIERTNAQLHVYDPPAYPSDSIEYPDGPSVHPFDLVYDPERKALIVSLVYNSIGTQTNQLVRYAYSAAGWQQTARIFIPYRSAFSLSADGRRLLLAKPGDEDAFSVDELDPVTFEALRTTAYPYPHEAFSIAVSNDGKALIGTGSSCCTGGVHPVLVYSPLRRSISTLLPPGPIATIPAPVLEGETVAASGDGSLVLAFQTYYERVVRYISGSDQVQYFDAQQTIGVANLAINRRGSLVLSNHGTLYDSEFEQLGELPSSTRGSVLAPEGALIYTYDDSDEVRVFDSSLPVVDGMLTEVLPAITLSATPAGIYAATPMVVSPDGGTLFVAGRERMIVQPLP